MVEKEYLPIDQGKVYKDTHFMYLVWFFAINLIVRVQAGVRSGRIGIDIGLLQSSYLQVHRQDIA